MKNIFILLIFLLCSCTNLNYQSNVKEERPKERTVQKSTSIESTIAESYTNIIDTGENRVNNILLACQKINGLKINPGEEFSFNRVVGERTLQAGYKSAPVLVDGEKSLDIGGGICQVSTTIYMAAVSGGFEITEHHNHSESVAYAPDGKDATVVFGFKDLKIINNKEIPIYLFVWVENQKIYSKIIKKELVLS